MPFLQNAWYAAGWSAALLDEPVAITIQNQPLVIYRKEDGTAVALFDSCPHRFAPLSRGKVKGDRIACGYHGLQFDGSGRCVLNPHGRGAVPAALSIRSYPLIERYGMNWVWMGQSDRADASLLPSLPALEDSELSWVYGQLHVVANYELVIDNLLDLSHVEFMHPFLAAEGNSARTLFRAEQSGDLVSAYYDIKGEPVSGLFQLLLTGPETHGDMRAYMHWMAPSNLYLDTGMTVSTEGKASAALIPTVHLLSPESDDTTNYFWAAGRNRCHGDEQISGMLRFGTQNAFENEDEPMIRAVRSRMHSNDLFAHKPALLPIDEAAVRARRVLARLIEEEQAGTRLLA